MIPATTPTFLISLKNADLYLNETISLKVYIKQQDVLIVKDMSDVTIDTDASTIAVTLSQKESAKFLYKKGDIEFQVHGLLADGETAWKTYVVAVPVDRTLSKEIITSND